MLRINFRWCLSKVVLFSDCVLIYQLWKSTFHNLFFLASSRKPEHFLPLPDLTLEVIQIVERFLEKKAIVQHTTIVQHQFPLMSKILSSLLPKNEQDFDLKLIMNEK